MILHAEVAGQGRPVALLHGLFGRARNLGGIARALSRRHQVISLDLRNHGDSPHAQGMDYETLAADVIETLDQAGALPAALIGHSMGGKAAMAAALCFPEAVSCLLVADIAPIGYDHHNGLIVAALQAIPLEAGLTRAAADAALARSVPDPVLRGFLLQNLQPGAAPTWRIGLAEIGAGMSEIQGWPSGLAGRRYPGRVCFVAGGRSDYLGPESRRAAERVFPGASFVTIDGAGHWLHADRPAPFIEAVEAFLG